MRTSPARYNSYSSHNNQHSRDRRNRAAALLATGTLIATTVVGLAVAPASSASQPAQPSRPAQPSQPAASKSAIVSGNARFEVLSPTLIRTEYAGDSHFVDAGTFNAIGRDSFRRTPFTAKQKGGWLTISTAKLTLRYQVGSGPFSTDNLTVALKDGAQSVTGHPWSITAAPTCAVGVRCEAEDLSLNGPSIATDHAGYTGRGFAAGFQATGNSVSWDSTISTAGSYDIAARYANSTGGDGQNVTRTLSVTVDGTPGPTISLPPTTNWDTWAVASATVTLPAGRHHLSITRTASDTGNVNLDNLAVLPTGAAYPPVTPPAPQPCAFGSICEAETGSLTGGAKLATDHNDYSGDGFVAGLESTTAAESIQLTDVPKAGDYQLQLRYANAAAGAQAIQSRKVSITVGSNPPTTATLVPTNSWDAWRIVSIPVRLAKGANTVTLGCPDSASCNVNLDTIAFENKGVSLQAPHAPLGGYRRGLDGVDGGALSNPGLLYQDGWSLIDDSASAEYDPRTQQVTQKVVPAGGYLDGYVFGYGQNYQQGLQDLATLTGPPELLPRWAYGIWYSEYYDRTAADYENTILPKFRSEGVPLDVLVTDTDFKTPNQWNGWEIDTSKFPDPSGYFDWAHSQGLHTALNIHPSILASDPQFAQAQATAKGKLKPGSCGGGGSNCYVFDFGDPDQLQAYLDLHKGLEQDGNDLWWLDWCCDGSSSSLAGVTPDAWINQQYKDETSKLVGRGFAFSRAYGSLQAGGYSGPTAVPTGPWADKRTTLHFTGDTISDWATLQYEVGYTPGESAATGMASISHDIGGHTGGLQEPGTEPGSTKLPDDLYARWVQLGTFQPIDRLHSNHSDRLPWQYGAAADSSAEKFLNLREKLLPYTYTLASQSNTTGVPIVRPLYLDYPDQQEAYANADNEYLYGPDVLVAPATTPGTSATTTVWFPAGSSWTDYFTGKTYAGGTSAQITTDLSTMPVFLRSGGILTTRTDNVSNDVQNPLTQATVQVAEGANGHSSLYEDDGNTTVASQHTTTAIDYSEHGRTHQVTIGAACGSFSGQIKQRAWTVTFTNAAAPTVVSINGRKVSADFWTWDGNTRTVTVHAPAQPTNHRLTVSYR